MLKQYKEKVTSFLKLLDINLTNVFTQLGTVTYVNTNSETGNYFLMLKDINEDEEEVAILCIQKTETAPAPWDEFLFREGLEEYYKELVLELIREDRLDTVKLV